MLFTFLDFSIGSPNFFMRSIWCHSLTILANSCIQVNKDTAVDAPSSSTSTAPDAEDIHDDDVDDDDDDLDMDELNELEASLSKTTLQIKEPNGNV